MRAIVYDSRMPATSSPSRLHHMFTRYVSSHVVNALAVSVGLVTFNHRQAQHCTNRRCFICFHWATCLIFPTRSARYLGQSGLLSYEELIIMCKMKPIHSISVFRHSAFSTFRSQGGEPTSPAGVSAAPYCACSSSLRKCCGSGRARCFRHSPCKPAAGTTPLRTT